MHYELSKISLALWRDTTVVVVIVFETDSKIGIKSKLIVNVQLVKKLAY